ncbi:4Fe-4S binding protein [Commensalibacter papalotli (ex Botero et al. 2024)]|uniref:Polyferredoxin NapH (NapH) (PUBMED:27322068) n=1 Tax=Commensalibacter papalotli (ex Botero et al. 2024) TaxID=2972766 RepID=A0ABM9HUX1_9PROT|nr:4Fe-4S binding protein [Commensalibacter papalotli (ex Botero et al. 2024)]CAI3957320.1 Polyferredoxin NapH (NapH) (PUBMED:27322068) [Commensalibacter papalotli (ex Botero et al. 2024)]CAI3957765.1 Polyferredoxin NapH (NapH) (PUBMED:27322068) [Commensalibacter papalotli (ex Botero et al. 2024)]
MISKILHKLGVAMQRHKGIIQITQWGIVGLYLVLLIIPTFMDLPPRHAHILSNLVLFAQFIFWGIWWPFVILSMLVMGRVWCGVFCPEGALTEWTSKKFGKNKTIPRWIKWKGWPAIAFILTTLYGQLISVYDYAQAALLILGGSTIGAIIVGFFYGKENRVWCRYLCPVNGVFNLLSRLSPISFKSNTKKWANYHGEQLSNPHCPPMINIRQLHGVSSCHMCGRCAGYRDAISLQSRSVNEEIIVYGGEKGNIWQTRLLLFGMIGVAIGAFTWTVSPWFVQLKQLLANWLINHNIFWPLNATAPWWILTNYPDNNDSFNWLDGFCVTFYILGSGLIFGFGLTIIYKLLGRFLRKPNLYLYISQALIPLAAAGLFLGLTATSVKLLQYDGIILGWIKNARAIILIGAGLWSLYLGYKILRKITNNIYQFILSFCLFCFSLIPILAAWWFMFWGW